MLSTFRTLLFFNIAFFSTFLFADLKRPEPIAIYYGQKKIINLKNKKLGRGGIGDVYSYSRTKVIKVLTGINEQERPVLYQIMLDSNKMAIKLSKKHPDIFVRIYSIAPATVEYENGKKLFYPVGKA